MPGTLLVSPGDDAAATNDTLGLAGQLESGPLGGTLGIAIKSGRGTWPVDSAATCPTGKVRTPGDGRSP